MKKFLFLLAISFNSYAFDITSGISGSWYDSTNTGQGFNIEVLENNRIIIYWYSYDQGNPIWLVGSGTYEGNKSTLDLSYFQGSNFGINHSANLVSNQPFGNATFIFDNCNSGNMTYNSSIAGYGSGSIKLDRLTTISGLQCSDTLVTPIVNNSPILLEDIGNNSFRFNAQAGKSYVVELFNVARSLIDTNGTNCDHPHHSDGVGLIISDTSSTEIAKQCLPQGFGNVHNSIQFKAGIDGEFQIDVVPNLVNTDISGKYSIRIQPEHNDSNVIWDANFEPNNRAIIASPIGIGAQNALTSNIEERNSSFATSQTDFDWYHFNTIANKKYIIELFNVIKRLGTEDGTNCNHPHNRYGVGLKILDDLFTEIKSECLPNGMGNIHNRILFKSGLGGDFHIGVIPNSATAFGTYSIRVLPFHDDSLSSWDINTHEPNNHPVNAYLIEPFKVIKSKIEERNTSFATNSVDLDYYRFKAEASQTYRIELFDVSSNLIVGNGTHCDHPHHSDGVGLKILDSEFIVINSQCNPTKEPGIHNMIEIKTGLSGTYYIGVIPNSNDVFGSYSIRLSKI